MCYLTVGALAGCDPELIAAPDDVIRHAFPFVVCGHYGMHKSAWARFRALMRNDVGSSRNQLRLSNCTFGAIMDINSFSNFDIGPSKVHFLNVSFSNHGMGTLLVPKRPCRPCLDHGGFVKICNIYLIYHKSHSKFDSMSNMVFNK